MIPYKFNPMGISPGGGEPIPGSRGVFLTSNGVAVSSAMIVSGGTIGTGYDADRISAYSRGKVLGVSILTGGQMVLSGGVASGATVYGFLIVSSGGVTSNAEVWYREQVRSGGRSYNSIVMSGVQYAYDGGTVIGATVGYPGFQYVSSGGVTSDTIVSSGGQMIVFDGGVTSAPVVSSAARLTVSSGAAAFNVTSAPGAIVTVVTGGTITYA